MWSGRDGTQKVPRPTAGLRAALWLVENTNQSQEFNSTSTYGTYSVQGRVLGRVTGQALSWHLSAAHRGTLRAAGADRQLRRYRARLGAEDPSDAWALWGPELGSQLGPHPLAENLLSHGPLGILPRLRDTGDGGDGEDSIGYQNIAWGQQA